MTRLFASNVKYILSQHLWKVVLCWVAVVVILQKVASFLFGLHSIFMLWHIYFIATIIVFLGIFAVHKRMVREFKRKYRDF